MNFKKILFKTNSIDAEKALPDAIIFTEKDGKIQWVNDVAAEIFETSKMHLMTSNISDIIENANAMITNVTIMHKPAIVKLKDKEQYYDMTVREIEDGYVLDFRDAEGSSYNNYNQEDEGEVNREKNNFLLKLSNDLKSPIQSIVGFSQAMADGLGGSMSEQQAKYIKIINKSSTELMYFIAKLLELSQTESLLSSPDKKTFDLASVINSLIKFNEHLYTGKDIKFTINIQEGFKKNILTDAEMFKNIIQNILEVILKSVEMGEIVVDLSNPDDDFIASKNLKPGLYAKVSVSSSSMLLSENELDCLFDPYKIVDTSNRKNVLRAITLASVKNLVQALGGVVWVESQILKSTSFNVIIPEQ